MAHIVQPAVVLDLLAHKHIAVAFQYTELRVFELLSVLLMNNAMERNVCDQPHELVCMLVMDILYEYKKY